MQKSAVQNKRTYCTMLKIPETSEEQFFKYLAKLYTLDIPCCLVEVLPTFHPLVIDIDAFLKESLSTPEHMADLYRLLLDDPKQPCSLTEEAPPLGRSTEPKVHQFRCLTLVAVTPSHPTPLPQGSCAASCPTFSTRPSA